MCARERATRDHDDTGYRPVGPTSLPLPSVCLLGGGDERERRERVWWNDGFVRRTEGDVSFDFGVYRVCRIVQKKQGTSQRLPGHGRCTFAKSYLISEAALLDSTITMIEYFYIR